MTTTTSAAEDMALAAPDARPINTAVTSPQAPQDDHESDVRAAIGGDKHARARLLAAIQPQIVRYCRARVGRQESSFASADDVAQEVCLGVLTALSSYRDQGRPFLAFVYGIAAHKVADARRTVARNRSEPMAELPEVPDDEAGPEQRAMRSELSAELAKLLAILTPTQREILVLRLMVGLSAEATAEATGSTAGAVRVAQHRALTRLRATLAARSSSGSRDTVRRAQPLTSRRPRS